MREQCGQVYPVWTVLGWVRWQGVPNPERQMMIEYRRCQADGIREERGGFIGVLCKEHDHK